MTNTTLQKARRIYQAGGVHNGYPGVYAVRSTSGCEYLVSVAGEGRCSCPSAAPCSHRAAVEIYRSNRRRRLAA